MNIRKIIEETIVDIITKEIINEVLRRLENIPKKALVIFTGGSIGFKDSMEQIKKLKEDGWKLKVLLSRSAEDVLTKELIEKMMGPKKVEIHVESDGRETGYYYSDIDKIILPVLTMNTAAKIALGVSDTLVTNIISHCLMTSIPIVAAKNACDPLNEERISVGMGKASVAYIKIRENYLEQLKDYGIKLVSANELYDTVLEKTKGNINKKSKKEVVFEKKVLTRAGVIDAFNRNRDVVVSSKTILTEIAKETAKNLGVKISMIDKLLEY